MDKSEEEFLNSHRSQFSAVGLPQSLWSVVYHKLSLSQDEREDDVMNSFNLLKNYNLKYPKDIRENSYSLISKSTIPSESDIFLFSHIIKLNDLNEANLKIQLLQNPELQLILWNFFNCDDYVITQTLNNASKLNMYFTLQNIFNDIPSSVLLYILSKHRWEFLPATIAVEEYKSSEIKPPIFDYYFSKKYIWEQEEDSVTVYVAIPNDATKKTINLSLTKAMCTLQVNNEQILSGSLFSRIDPDESYWTLERDAENQNTTLLLTLKKENTGDIWASIFVDEEKCNREESEVLLLPRDKITQSANEWEQDEDRVKSLIEKNRLLNHSNEKRVDIIIHLLQSYYGQSYAESRPSLSSNSGYEISNVWYVLDQQGSAITFINKGEEDLKVNSKCVVFINVFTFQTMSILWPISDISPGEEVVSYRTSLTWSNNLSPKSFSK